MRSVESRSFKELIPRRVKAIGALDFDKEPTGLRPRRLPDWTRNQVPQGLDAMIRMPSGVRLEFRTDSTFIGIEVLVTSMGFLEGQSREIAFNLECDGQLFSGWSVGGNTIVADSESPAGFKILRGKPNVVVFDELPPGMKNVCVWLPHNAYVELRNLQLENRAKLTHIETKKLRWVHYGSSISHCMEAREPAFTWPAVASRLSGLSLINLGVGGQ